MTPVLSVVIPIYKVEQYLERCVNSVLNQDFQDLEVILVDDGSPDRCPQICDDFAEKDSRVKVVHKPNGGLSSARNAGIDVANGKYIAFLDSDDQWKKDGLKPLIELAQNTYAQLIMFASVSFYEEEDGYYSRNDYGFFDKWKDTITSEQIYPYLIEYGNLQEHACTKFINLAFLRQHNLYFKAGILGEDTEWMFRMLREKVSIFVVNIPLYIYTENRAGSIVNTASTKSVRDLISTVKNSLEYYQNNPDAPTKQFELAHCAYLWSIAFGIFNNVPDVERVEIKKILKDVGKQLDLSSHPKSKKVGVLYKVLGFNMTAWVLCRYIKLHARNIINRKKKING